VVATISDVKIDGRDAKIIRALERDARTSFADIARDCGVSIDTITKRYRKMLRSGVLKGTTLLLNSKSFGHEYVASLELNVDFSHVEEVVETVRGIPEIVFVTRSMGRKKVFAIAFLGSVEALSQLNAFLKGLPLIKEVKSSLWVGDLLLCPENFELDRVMRR
jgi:DNA-binding Lrp family transcriptional regulator